MPRKPGRRKADEAELAERETLGLLADIPVAPPTEVGDADIAAFVIPLLLDPESRLNETDMVRQVERQFGIDYSLRKLHALEDTQVFRELWPLSSHRDPRIEVARAQFANLVVVAVEQMRQMLISADTPASVRMKVIEKILELAGVEEERAPSNLGEMQRFLEQLGARGLQQINIGTLIQQVVPTALLEAGEVIDNPTAERNLTGVGWGVVGAEEGVVEEVGGEPDGT